MLLWVPEPVCHTYSGKWSSSPPVNSLVGSSDDRVGLPCGKSTRPLVDDRSGLLDVAVRVVDRFGHAIVPDGEVLQGPLSLGAPVAICRDIDRSHAVELPATPGRIDSDGSSRMPPIRSNCLDLSMFIGLFST